MPSGGAKAWCAVAALTILATGLLAVAGEADGPLRYVALGDSYTAGPSIPNQLGDPAGCRRSDRNYPHLVAAALGADLRDVSCSGATTIDLRFPQRVTGGANPPQLDAVGTESDVVTLGIGGNDIGFGEIVTQCVSLEPLGHPCQDLFAGAGGDEVSRRIASAALRVSGALAEIRLRAPRARIFVVGYPAILPGYGAGCWPVMPFTFDDALYLRGKEQELNAMLAAQAAAAGVTYVDVYGATEGHDACQPPTVRWIEPVVPIAAADPVHPNALGMRAMATAVAGAVAGRPVILPADPGITVRVGGS